jgi:hypothetical protein
MQIHSSNKSLTLSSIERNEGSMGKDESYGVHSSDGGVANGEPYASKRLVSNKVGIS